MDEPNDNCGFIKYRVEGQQKQEASCAEEIRDVVRDLLAQNPGATITASIEDEEVLLFTVGVSFLDLGGNA